MFNYIKQKIGFGKIKYEISDEDKNTIFEHTNTKLGLLANYGIVFLIFLSIIIVFIDSIQGINQKYGKEIFFIDFFISIIFLIEYLYRWKQSSHKTQFPFRIMNILDLLSFLPFFILVTMYGIGSYSIFALFRIFRIFRIFELVERIPIMKKILSGIMKNRVEYVSALFVILIVLVLSSTLVYLFEKDGGNIVNFHSIPQTFWWAIVTLSTTGYGDVVPISTGGKFIAGILMILGPVLITIISSITVIIFIDSTKIIDIKIKNITCKNCGTENENDAKYCKKCGKRI